MAGATVIDLREDALHYYYVVRGMEYTATQDISAVSEHLPSDRSTLFGPATVKYLPRNPANSILVCEEWSGLREKKGAVPG